MIRHGVLGLLIACALPLQAQDLVFSPGILANDITNISAAGESVWVGPYLNVSHDGGETWLARKRRLAQRICKLCILAGSERPAYLGWTRG